MLIFGIRRGLRYFLSTPWDCGWAGAGWGFGSITVTDHFYDLTGLMQGGNFQWRVTANCGTLSAPSATAFYSTPCVAPINLTTTKFNIVASPQSLPRHLPIR